MEAVEHWQQAVLSDTRKPFEDVLGAIVAWDGRGNLALIGTAFLVDIAEGRAAAITAAHNFDGIRQAQCANRTHHHTALHEFLGDLEKVDLDENRVRVVCSNNGSIDLAKVTFAAWSTAQDIGYLVLEAQSSREFFSSTLSLRATPPKLGGDVALLGFSHMTIEEHSNQGGQFERAQISRRLLLRRGWVTAEYPEGHILCRGPCIQTSIPVFPGMSGGPALLLGEEGEQICAFGLISSDSNASDEQKNDSTHPGDATVALLLAEAVRDNGNVSIKLRSPSISRSQPS